MPSRVLAGTPAGLSISTDGGATFINRTTADGLGPNEVDKIAISGDTIIAGTPEGLAVSVDGGKTFVNKRKSDGLANDVIRDVKIVGNVIYVATPTGLSVSKVRAMADSHPSAMVG